MADDLEFGSRPKGQRCETGCMNFSGGEIRHHKDCAFYAGSLTELAQKISGERDRYKDALDNIRMESSQFYAKWYSRMGDHPIFGFACDIELRAEKALATEKDDRK